MKAHILYRYRPDEALRRQLADVNASLQALAAALEANNHIQQVGRPPQYVIHRHQWRRTPPKPGPALIFPISLVAAGIDGLLTRCDQAVGRWVQAGILARWMQRILAGRRTHRPA